MSTLLSCHHSGDTAMAQSFCISGLLLRRSDCQRKRAFGKFRKLYWPSSHKNDSKYDCKATSAILTGNLRAFMISLVLRAHCCVVFSTPHFPEVNKQPWDFTMRKSEFLLLSLSLMITTLFSFTIAAVTNIKCIYCIYCRFFP